jgi:hypothetical protein
MDSIATAVHVRVWNLRRAVALISALAATSVVPTSALLDRSINCASQDLCCG